MSLLSRTFSQYQASDRCVGREEVRDVPHRSSHGEQRARVANMLSDFRDLGSEAFCP